MATRPNFSRPRASVRSLQFSPVPSLNLPVEREVREHAARQRPASLYSVSDYGEDDDVESIEEKKPHLEREVSFRSIGEHQSTVSKYYRPTSNRTWALSLILGAIGLCILLLELTLMAHGSSNDTHLTDRRSIIPRSNEANVFVPRSSIISNTVVSISSDGGGPVTDPPDTSTTTGGDSGIPGFPNPADQQTLDPTPTDSGPSGFPNPADQQTLKTTVTAPVYSPVPSNQQDLTAKVTPTYTTQTPGDPIPSKQQSLDPVVGGAISTTKANGAAAVPDQTTPASNITPAPTLTSNNVAVSTAVGSVTSDGKVIPTSSVVALAVSSTTSVFSYTSDGKILTSSVVLSYTATSATVSVSNKVTTFTSDGKVYTSTAQYLSGSSLTTKIGTYTSGGQVFTSTGVFAVATSQPSLGLPDGTSAFGTGGGESPVSGGRFTQWDYFLAVYTPSILAILLKSVWMVVFVTFKMMEPFYQMARPGGASGSASLTSEYLSEGLSWQIFKAVFDGQWVLLLAGTVQILLAIVASLAGDTMTVLPTAYCKTEISDHQPCQPKWFVNVPVMRAVELLLIACFSMTVSIIILNHQRISGVYNDPSRISTMADLFTHRPLVEEMRQLPPSATAEQIEQLIQDNRYMLGTFETQGGHRHYGIIKLDAVGNPASLSVEKTFLDRVKKAPEAAADSVMSSIPYADDLLLLSISVILFIIVLTYYFSSSTAPGSLNVFMNSNKFGPSFMLSALSVMMSFMIKRKERNMRLTAPYIAMSEPPAKEATNTISAGLLATNYTSMALSLKHGEYLLAYMAFIAFLPDALVLILPGIPWSPAQTAPQYTASTWSALICLAFITIGISWAIYKDEMRKRKYGIMHYKNECPDNLAVVLHRLCGSKLVDDRLKEQEEADRVALESKSTNTKRFTVSNFTVKSVKEEHRCRYHGKDVPKKYRYAFIAGVDGVQRWTVDQEIDVHERRRST